MEIKIGVAMVGFTIAFFILNYLELKGIGTKTEGKIFWSLVIAVALFLIF